MYSALRTTFEAWSCIESQSIEIVQKYMLNYYKYGYEDMKVLRGLLKERDLKLQTYSKFESKLNVKKEKMWDKQGEKEEAFKTMLPKDTSSALNKIKQDLLLN